MNILEQIKQFKQDTQILIGLTWFNFNSGKPDLIDITNGCTDKYIPATTALKGEDKDVSNAYSWFAPQPMLKEIPRLIPMDVPDYFALTNFQPAFKPINYDRTIHTRLSYHPRNGFDEPRSPIYFQDGFAELASPKNNGAD